MEIFEASIRLNFRESLVMGHINDIHKMDNVVKDDKGHIIKDIDVGRFGLFETAAPNFQTYYPDVTAEDLMPKEEDFITPVFRALSCVVVNKKWNPVDFSKDGVLKASVNKLIGQTIYSNHEAMVGNELGVVSDAVWQESYYAGKIEVPAGINATFKIDGKSHPNIVRKLQMKPPAIHSNSVTIQFLWAQSHPKMDRGEFLGKLGTFDEKGELYRRIASEVLFYHETSLVSHGADPFAQMVDKDGKIVNPKYGAGIDSLSAEVRDKVRNYYDFSYKHDLISLSANPTIPDNHNKNKPEEHTQKFMKKELILFLAALGFIAADENADVLSFNKDGKAFSLEEAQAALVAIKAEAATAATLKQENTDLQTSLTEKDNKITELSSEVTTLKENDPTKALAALTGLVDEVTADYKKLKADKADPNWVTSLSKMDYAGLKALKAEYQIELDKKFPMECQDCHSHKVVRASAAAGPDDEDEDEDDNRKKPVTLSRDQALDKLRKQGMKANTEKMHGEVKP